MVRIHVRERPEYYALLERLGPLAAERQSLLRGYFEATEEQRAEGIKTPTAAHRALADLVASGLIRVIVTTNFDRLLESALESAGVGPLVIATADQAVGAPPLPHNACTIIKVHGDYLDTRTRNSDAELALYDPAIDALLDQVFDEYGLIVCGWSGKYDIALRAAMERCPSRRYTTYWCVRGATSSAADGLIAHRAAQVIEIADADSFFTQLLEHVTTIRETGERHPFETRVAVETLKRYLTEDRHRIRLRELVRESTEELVSHLNPDVFPTSIAFSEEELVARTQKLEALSATSLTLTANGCRWGEASHDDAWLGVVRRLVEFDAPQADLIPSEDDYTDAFDRYEYLARLVHQDLSGFAIEGLFVWRGRARQLIGSEIGEAQGDWQPLRAGLFDGSVERFQKAKSAIDQATARLRW